MPKKRERVGGCRLPFWLPQVAETGHWVNLAPSGNTLCRESQTGKVPRPAWHGKLCRFNRQICTVKANFRQVELTSIAGKFEPHIMQYSAFVALALPEYKGEVKAKAAPVKAKATKAKAAQKPKRPKVMTRSEAADANARLKVRIAFRDGFITAEQMEKSLADLAK